MVQIVPAKGTDTAVLSHIAQTAKAYWGYPAHWLALWQEALTVTPADLQRWTVMMAVTEAGPVGFSALARQGETAVLMHLWVLPAAMGQGVGRALWQRGVETAVSWPTRALLVEADPHARGFYQQMGATLIGHNYYPLDGQVRALPLLIFALPVNQETPG